MSTIIPHATYNALTATLGDLAEAGLFLCAYRNGKDEWMVLYSDQPFNVESEVNYREESIFSERGAFLYDDRVFPSRPTHVTHIVRTPMYRVAYGRTFREALEKVLSDA